MKIIYKIIGVLTFLLSACNNASTSYKNNNGPDSDTEDDTALCDTMLLNVTQPFETPDLRLAEVKGNVKIVSYIDPQYGEYKKIKFDREGNIRAFDEHTFNELKRDNTGQIISLASDHYRYKWDEGMPSMQILTESDGSVITTTFSYDHDNRIIKEVIEYNHTGDFTTEREIVEYSYNDSDVDIHGNWIRRNGKNNSIGEVFTQERRIVYY